MLYIDSLHKTLKDQESNLAQTLKDFEALKPDTEVSNETGNPNEMPQV